MGAVYCLETEKRVEKAFEKMAKKDKAQYEAIFKKIRQILENPYQFKPLKKPLQNYRRVHVGSFVLVYTIDEKSKVVRVCNYKHHDEIYKSS